jgi:hypothetical protein
VNTPRTRTLLAAPLLVVALVSLSGCGADSEPMDPPDQGSAAEQSDAADSSAGGTLALTADGSVAVKCAMPSAETLSTFDTAFAGTVISVDGGTATLSVDQWYAGGDGADTVTVESPSKDLQDLLLAVDFQDGKPYLVSATDTRVTLCGFTAEQSPELQALYDEAFAQ